MAEVVSMANDDGRNVHPFFMPKASEFPSCQFHVIPKPMSKAEFM